MIRKQNRKYIAAISILLTLEVIFLPILKLGEWNISLIGIIRKVFFKVDDIYFDSVKEILKEYMWKYIGTLIILVLLTIATAYVTWIMKTTVTYVMALCGQCCTLMWTILILKTISDKFNTITNLVSYFGMGDIVKFKVLQLLIWGILHIVAFVIIVSELLSISTEDKKALHSKELLIPTHVKEKYIFNERKNSCEYENRYEMPRGEVEFFGAILGVKSPYIGKAFMLEERKYVYILQEDNKILVKKYLKSPNERCLAKVYYETKYGEYVVAPQKKGAICLESGQPLGAERRYFLPREMRIIVKDEVENIFELG